MDDFSWLKTAIDKIETKVDRLDQRLDSLDNTSIGQAKDLQQHILRTEIAEENIALLREQFEPIKTQSDRIGFTFKIIGFLATATGLVSSVLKIFNVF